MFKKYSQMQLQMKREALAKLNRKANDKGSLAQERPREGVLAQLELKMESSEVGTFAEVLCFQRSSGATRRDRTGDLLITNQPLYQLS